MLNSMLSAKKERLSDWFRRWELWYAGHASLVNRAVAENDVVVVSDFVNPTQFNDQNDLLKYPRTREADCALLEKCGATLALLLL